MMNSAYNDNRPDDGQDERERWRAEHEGADFDTLTRFNDLILRLRIAQLIDDATVREILRANLVLAAQLDLLLDKEGF